MAIADLTITYVREEAVDFTMPFMNLGISILFKKPTKKVPKLFSFLSPLSVEVWLYMATAFLVARFSAYEWVNPHPCDLEPEELENQFTLLNTLWFTIGCLMCQGCDITPRWYIRALLYELKCAAHLNWRSRQPGASFEQKSPGPLISSPTALSAVPHP
ncbi:glutamate receptor ionotropic, kainate 1 [Trichonephila clavipes]|nr:glutamate receptor ionotropic, kainate 1 [Trichonephila clavipes]